MRENYAFRMKQQIEAQKEKLGETLKSKAKRTTREKKMGKIKEEKIWREMADLSDPEFFYCFFPGLSKAQGPWGIDVNKKLPYAPDSLLTTYLKDINPYYIPIIREFLQGYVVQGRHSLSDPAALKNYFMEKNFKMEDIRTLAAAFSHARAWFYQHYIITIGATPYNVDPLKAAFKMDMENFPSHVNDFFAEDIKKVFNDCRISELPAGGAVKDLYRKIMFEHNMQTGTANKIFLGFLQASGFYGYKISTQTSSSLYKKRLKAGKRIGEAEEIVTNDYTELNLSELYVRHITNFNCEVNNHEVTEAPAPMKITTAGGELLCDGEKSTGGVRLAADFYTPFMDLFSPITWSNFVSNVTDQLAKEAGNLVRGTVPYIIEGGRIKTMIEANAKGDDQYFVGKLFNHVLAYTKDNYKAKLADMSNIVFEDEDKIKEVVENGFDDFLESLRNGK